MDTFYKTAYDAGTTQALVDFGLVDPSGLSREKQANLRILEAIRAKRQALNEAAGRFAPSLSKPLHSVSDVGTYVRAAGREGAATTKALAAEKARRAKEWALQQARDAADAAAQTGAGKVVSDVAASGKKALTAAEELAANPEVLAIPASGLLGYGVGSDVGDGALGGIVGGAAGVLGGVGGVKALQRLRAAKALEAATGLGLGGKLGLGITAGTVPLSALAGRGVGSLKESSDKTAGLGRLLKALNKPLDKAITIPVTPLTLALGVSAPTTALTMLGVVKAREALQD
tara:strand:- start:6388 stop:7251 length:864 start_codon:yes stop_codon:yes gene_type:complete